MFDAHEERTTRIADVKGAHLKAHVDEFLMTKLEGDQFDVMHDVSKD